MAGSKLDKVVQFGAGGAGAAVAYALLELGVAELVLVDTDRRARGAAQAELYGGHGRPCSHSRPTRGRKSLGADGIVNATPVGMAKYPGVPFPAELLSSGQWVAEIIYFPEETELLRLARALGCRTLAGTGMAVNQAVRAFELFTGLAAGSTRDGAPFRGRGMTMPLRPDHIERAAWPCRSLFEHDRQRLAAVHATPAGRLGRITVL